MCGGAPGASLAPSSSVLSVAGCSYRLTCPLPAPGHKSQMLLELPGMNRDPGGSREQELRSNHGQEQREWAGLGSAESWDRGEG